MLANELQSLNAFFLILLTKAGILIFSNNWQDSKAPSPISLKDEGKSNWDKTLQYLKDDSPICSSTSEEENKTIAKCSQYSKALSLIEFNEKGKVIEVNELHPLKALSLISVKEEADEKSISVNEQQPSNALDPICVTEERILKAVTINKYNR